VTVTREPLEKKGKKKKRQWSPPWTEPPPPPPKSPLAGPPRLPNLPSPPSTEERLPARKRSIPLPLCSVQRGCDSLSAVQTGASGCKLSRSSSVQLEAPRLPAAQIDRIAGADALPALSPPNPVSHPAAADARRPSSPASA
jgi:hypothetical protein